MVKDKVSYIKAISGCKEYNGSNDNLLKESKYKKRIETALDKALDIRKFEIDLYWKRAQYFWLFIASIYGGYISILSKSLNECPERPFYLLGLSSVAVVFSLAWHFANRGSKFWQNNWENHVDMLEDIVYGPIYKTIIYKKDNWNLNVLSAAPFSVSKINTAVSFIMLIVSLILFETNFFLCFDTIKSFIEKNVSNEEILSHTNFINFNLLFLCVALFVMSFVRSDLAKNKRSLSIFSIIRFILSKLKFIAIFFSNIISLYKFITKSYTTIKSFRKFGMINFWKISPTDKKTIIFHSRK